MSARDLSSAPDDTLLAAVGGMFDDVDPVPAHAVDGCRDLTALASRSAATSPTPGVASLPRPGLAAAPASPGGGTLAFPGHLRLRRELGQIEVIAAFTVEGEPVSKSRARFTNRGSKTQAYTPEKTHQAEQVMAWKFRSVAGQYRLNADAAYGVAAVFYNGTRQRRDVDNMMKLVLDGLNGVAWVDDEQVVEISARKELVDRARARTTVLIYQAGEVQRNLARCEHCGASFPTYPSLEGRIRYCSLQCRNAKIRNSHEHVCEHCGKPFTGGKLTKKPKYCSQVCHYAAGRAVVNCTHCGAEFTKQRCHVREKNFCSALCRGRAQRPRREAAAQGVCETCGGPTSKKAYKQCRSCRQPGEPLGRARPLGVGERTARGQLVLHITPVDGAR